MNSASWFPWPRGSGSLNLDLTFLVISVNAKYYLFQTAFVKYVHAGGHSSGTKTTSFNLRLILWEAGITVSNKVLECLVLRFSKNRLLSSESYVTVMVRLHLAHGELMIELR